jgi:hypothetical protein
MINPATQCLEIVEAPHTSSSYLDGTSPLSSS